MLRLFNVESGTYLGPIFISIKQLNDYVEKIIWPEDRYKFVIKIYTQVQEIPLEQK